jgi:hypothetical protein
MSGAEAIFLIGLIANITQLVEYTSIVIARFDDLTQDVKEVPASFRSLRDQLPLLSDTLNLISLKADTKDLDEATCVAVKPVLISFEGELIKLKVLFEHILPEDGASKTTILWKAIQSTRRDKEVENIAVSISGFVQALTLRFAVLSGLAATDSISQRARETKYTGIATAPVDARITDSLVEVEGAAFDSVRSRRKNLCLPGTRVEVLDEVIEWCNGSSNQNIFWLRGMAGTGKTTISTTVASQLASNNQLGGSYFFSRGQGTLSGTAHVITTLAVQLCRASSAWDKSIRQAISQSPDIAKQTQREQWKTLVLEPLASLDNAMTPMSTFVFVIDALDECDNEDDLRLLLQLFAEADISSRVRLRVFVTSRPETFVLLGFKKLSSSSHLQFVLQDVPAADINRDLRTFFYTELDRIREEKEEDEDWPSESLVDGLVKKSGGLFIFAATAVRFISNSTLEPDECIDLILNHEYRSTSATKEIDSIYAMVLENSILRNCHGDEKLRVVDRFKTVVGSIVTAPDTFSLESLAELLNMNLKSIRSTLRPLHSVLSVPTETNKPVQLLHPSFRDFLINSDRCPPEFRVREDSSHTTLAEGCLKLLSGLKRDICCLKVPGACIEDVNSNTVDQGLPPHMRYACRYWLYHAMTSKGDFFQDNGVVHSWLLIHFLHWLEAMSLLGLMSQSIIILDELCSVLKVRPIQYK